MSETLWLEGPDRDALVAQIRAEYGHTATITGVKQVRHGGVLGFFAREHTVIAFQLADPERSTSTAAESVVAGGHAVDGPTTLTIEQLLERADSADGPHRATRVPAAEADSDQAFAQVLSQLVSAPGVEEPARSEQLPEHKAGVAPFRVPVGDRVGSLARTRLEMLAELRSVGVPLPIRPHAGEASLYEAIEQIVAALPAAPAPPSQAGEILVLTGAADQLEPAAVLLAQLAHIPSDAIWRADARRSGNRSINGPLDATRRALELRTGSTAALVTVELERAVGNDARYSWSSQVIAALSPTALWAAVDSGRKTEDLRAELAHLGPIDALLVTGAAYTSTPATVWDLEIPIALIDGRPATSGAWAGLLFDALSAGARS
jgi:hypothetical protein